MKFCLGHSLQVPYAVTLYILWTFPTCARACAHKHTHIVSVYFMHSNHSSNKERLCLWGALTDLSLTFWRRNYFFKF